MRLEIYEDRKVNPLEVLQECNGLREIETNINLRVTFEDLRYLGRSWTSCAMKYWSSSQLVMLRGMF